MRCEWLTLIGCGGHSSPMNSMWRTAATCAVALVCVSAPQAAFAVSASNNDGNGSENVTTWYNNGARLQGQLRSSAGKKVYFQDNFYTRFGAYGWERLTGDVTSTSYQSRDDTKSINDFNGVIRVDVRVCTNITAFPDSCGSAARINK